MYTSVRPSGDSVTNYVALLWIETGQPCDKVRRPQCNERLCVPLSAGNLSISWATIKSPRKTLIHGVSYILNFSLNVMYLPKTYPWERLTRDALLRVLLRNYTCQHCAVASPGVEFILPPILTCSTTNFAVSVFMIFIQSSKASLTQYRRNQNKGLLHNLWKISYLI